MKTDYTEKIVLTVLVTMAACLVTGIACVVYLVFFADYTLCL